jgi:hypothetical protein
MMRAKPDETAEMAVRDTLNCHRAARLVQAKKMLTVRGLWLNLRPAWLVEDRD